MAIQTLSINGTKVRVNTPPDMPLLWILRETLNLTGTKYGCGMGVCGACTVHVDDKAYRSCQITASFCENKNITTIEGLSEDGSHPVQKAWLELNVAQCGYCQCGQIMAAVALLKTNPAPSNREIDKVMSNQYCRCGTYKRIREAIHKASQLISKT